jgi:Flp pilus assembly protein TadD
MRARWLSLAPMLLTLTSFSLAQQWFSVQTDHLISYSDGNDRGAREAALRGERLIAVFEQVFHRKDINFATPLRVLASQAVAPLKEPQNRIVLVRTPAANFVTINLSQPDSWAQAAKSIAALTLEDNYPRAQPWFDTGIASYIAGVRFTGDQMELGEPPAGIVLPESSEWIPLAKLFESNEPSPLSATQRRVFEAESWVVVRWLIDNGRLAQAGAYLNAVQSRGATQERALVEAFSMGSGDLDREVRESAGKLSAKSTPAPRIESTLFKSQKVAAADAHVLTANLSLFGPEGDRALQELVGFMRENQENAAVHRALAWAFLLRHDLENAVEHIRRALLLDDSDPSMHYLYARWVNQGDEDAIHITSAEVRMGVELKAALKRDPKYAAALELLGLAQLSEDAVKPALASLQRASGLRPRSSRYYLNLALAYQAAGNLDSARNLMLYARAGGDAAVSAEAGELLNGIGKEKKRQQQWEAMGLHPDPHPDPNVKHSKYENLQEAIEEDEKAAAKSKSPEPPQDMRKIEYLKGRIVSVECGAAPGATLNVSSAGHTWQMHVVDRNIVVLIGADHFDCGWHNAAVSINYKRSGNFQGDLVSLEAN